MTLVVSGSHLKNTADATHSVGLCFHLAFVEVLDLCVCRGHFGLIETEVLGCK